MASAAALLGISCCLLVTLGCPRVIDSFSVPLHHPLVLLVYCAILAAKLVVRRAPFLGEQFSTIAYPAFLYYITLGIISMY
jgi:hypothetical protein